MAIIGASILFHFWRFPHLVTANGGGAFLILFVLSLFIIGLPLFIAEMALGKKVSVHSHPFVRVYNFIQWFLSQSFFLYLFFVCGLAIIYFFHFLMRMWNAEPLATVFSFYPSLPFRLSVAGGLIVLLALSLRESLEQSFEKIIRFFTPICIIIFTIILFRIFSVGGRWEGLKTLFYPDFFQLTPSALVQAIGHSLVTLFFGVGWLKRMSSQSGEYDLVELGIQACFISIFLGVFSGLMALPMMEQLSETPFGADWLFSILPRWMLYGRFGNYYCSLFFAALALISFFLLRLAAKVSIENLRGYPKFYFGSLYKTFFIANALFAVALSLLIHQKDRAGWFGPRFLFEVDHFFIDILVPLEALLLLGMLFSVTTYGERTGVFAKQKVFYHMEYFYRLWRLSCRWLIPLVILGAWLLTAL